MKILAIRFARLGDVILLLPALASLKAGFPGANLTFLTGHRCAPIAELCPAIDEIISVDRIAMRDRSWWNAVRQMAGLVRDVRRRHFDLVVDFHSFRETNLLALLSGAPARIGMKRHKAAYLGFCFNRPPVPEDKSIHVSEMFQRVSAAVSNARVPAGPAIVISGRESHAKPKDPRLVLYVDAPVPERIWAPERFAEVADFAAEKLNARVCVISGKEGAGLVERIRKASRNPERISFFTDLTLRELAQVIGSAQLLVSNDTGPMHLGPAAGVRTLGLFSVGYPEHFRPIGRDDRFLQANPIDEIGVKEVIGEVEQMWTTADRDLRR